MEVSVVIPCYNIQPFLAECLRSVISQEVGGWEAIIVDDCSTDGGPEEIIAAIGDPRIRLLRHAANRGLAAARNTGFEAAQAPLILPLDGDDILASSFLSKLLSLLESDPSLDCAFADFELFGAGSGIRSMQVEPLGVMTRYQWLPGAGVLMKRDLWIRAGKYNEDRVLRLGNEDWDFWLSAAEAGFRAAHLAEPLYRYRQHARNMSQGLSASDHITRHYLLKHHRAFFMEHGNSRQFLASGYWQAAEVARRHRRVMRSLALGARALTLNGDWPQGRRLLQNNLSMLLPEKLRSSLHSAKGRLSEKDKASENTSSTTQHSHDAAPEKA